MLTPLHPVTRSSTSPGRQILQRWAVMPNPQHRKVHQTIAAPDIKGSEGGAGAQQALQRSVADPHTIQPDFSQATGRDRLNLNI
jgi:hypothetical protein